jgi:hypothetical protein
LLPWFVVALALIVRRQQRRADSRRTAAGAADAVDLAAGDLDGRDRHEVALKDVATVGLKPIVLMVSETVFLAGLVVACHLRDALSKESKKSKRFLACYCQQYECHLSFNRSPSRQDLHMTTFLHRRHLCATSAPLSRHCLAPAALGARPRPTSHCAFIAAGPAGGSLDIVSRLLADGLQKELNRTVIVDPKPGAGGAIAVTDLMQAPHDGSTVVVALDAMVSEIPHA